MSKRNAGPESDLTTRTPKKRHKLMDHADGFSKSSTKPVSKFSTPKFDSAFGSITSAAPVSVKPSSKTARPQYEKAPKFVNSDMRATVPKPVLRALKPPVPLFDSGAKPAVNVPPPPPPPPPQLPNFPRPASRNAALKQLAVPPAPVASTSKTPVSLKPLVPPPPPPPPSQPHASSSKLATPLKHLVAPSLPPPAPPSDRLRTISTTALALATDLFTDNGASELASILLHDQHPEIQVSSMEDVDERRGVMMSPEKTNKGKERFIRNGLAARATALYDRTHASMSLWDADLSLSLANSASSSRRGLDPDLRLRILHILHIPSPVSNPSSSISIPGVALCHLLTSPPPPEHPSSVHSLSKGGIHAVLFSFSSLAPPRLHAPAQLCIRNPEDFAEGQEVYVWKPWQLLPMDTDALRRSIATNVDTDAAEEAAAAAVDVFDLFGSGPSKAQCRDHVSQTALVCERFVILK